MKSQLGSHVLVIDDEKNIRTTLSTCLEGMGCHVTAVSSAETALTALSRQVFDLAFLDLRLGDTDGLTFLPQLLAECPNLAIVVITAYATFDTAVEAIKRGAKDYLPKPFTPAQIRHVVEQLAEQRELTHRVTDLEGQLREAVPEVDLETNAPKMRAVLEMITRAAKSEATVLLRGESGTGKGVLARLLHAQSARASGPFVVVNCPTLSEELLASELFGHVKGAFTGAIRDQAGRVEAAQGGTLFLDEIGEISPGLQVKLLRFLQEKEFERIGENKTRRADVRVLYVWHTKMWIWKAAKMAGAACPTLKWQDRKTVGRAVPAIKLARLQHNSRSWCTAHIAATNHDIETDVKTGRFREDLLYRLNVIEVHTPPLRERPEDILRLARRFLAFFARSAGRPTLELSKAAEAALLAYPWPGNVRELRNAIERAVILWPAQVIEPQAFPESIVSHATSGPQLGGDFTLDTIEREHVIRVLARIKTLEEAAQILGIDSSTLWRKRKRYEE